VYVGDTLTIRLDPRDRATLEAAAKREGTGISALIRALAEAEARRLRDAEIRAEGERIVSYLRESPSARHELTLYGTPLSELED
jgi:hypothetical protein